jgi:predicted RNA-binding Zn-ribbon protein involved in translation (DUF1610 family)
MRRCLIALAVSFAFAGALVAEPSDETLRYFLSRTPWCVAGRFASEPAGEANESGIVRYQADVEVSEVLKGKPDGPKKFRVGILRLEKDQADRPPVLANDAKCVLFVRPAGGDAWETVDCWFGVQPYSAALAAGLKRIAGEKKAVPAAKGKVDPRPALDLIEFTDRLAGRWKLRLPVGAMYTAELTKIDDTHFRLTKAVRFSGDYEVRDKRLVLTKSFQGEKDADFEWELHAPDELVLVAQSPRISSPYLGATLTQEAKAPEPAAEKGQDDKAAPAPKPAPPKADVAPGPALDPTEHAPRLAGVWRLTLPAGATYNSELRRVDDTHFRLVKGVRFSGEYEIKGNRLVLSKPNQPIDAGFAWELRTPDELALVAAPPSVGTMYKGATLKQLAARDDFNAPASKVASRVPPAKAPGNVPPPAGQPEPPDVPSGIGRPLIYIGAGLAVGFVVLLGLAGLLALRLRGAARPSAAPRERTRAAGDDSVTATCPECGKTVKMRSDQAGKKLRCPQCGTVAVMQPN